MPSNKLAAVIIKIASARALIPSRAVTSIFLAPSKNGVAAFINRDNSKPSATRLRPKRDAMPANNSAPVRAIIAAASHPMPARTEPSIILDNTMNGTKLVIKPDKAAPRAGRISITAAAIAFMNAPIISPIPPASITIMLIPVSRNVSRDGK